MTFSALCACAVLAGAPPALQWSEALLSRPSAWSDRMNGALVTPYRGALRVEIAPGCAWAIAAIPSVCLPPGTERVTASVRSLSEGSRWLMRLFGDVRGTGRPATSSLAEQCARTGQTILEPDPRLMLLGHGQPVQLQLGIEGKPGDSVVFEGLEFASGAPSPRGATIPGQLPIAAVDLMPSLPQPYRMLDWRAKARAYDRLAFDWSARGQFLPLIWLDESRINVDAPTFGLPSYVGDPRQGTNGQESITCMGAVLGATVAGIDKREGPHDYVAMCQAFANRRNGSNLVLNLQDQGTGGSYWYDLFPHIVFYALADRYPDAGLEPVVRDTADRWARVVDAVDATFEHTGFDFASGKPVDNGKWREPDAAAGIAWMEYAAWTRWRDPAHLRAAQRCLRFLEERESNPYYECLLPWGVQAAAKMNAELGAEWDVDRLLNWCFDISDCRGGWGAIVQNWGGYDCAGLVGSVDNRGGYAFAMNTFSQAAALTPVARYDPRYARALGKWMLNLANAARLFYPTELPTSNQDCGWWQGDPEGAIAYEGLRRQRDGRSPFGTGDPIEFRWGPKTNLGLYGSSYVGLLGGIVSTTDVPGILALDCLATDFYHARAYPTHLYYNPHAAARMITVPLAGEPTDLYDAVSHRFLVEGTHGDAKVRIAGDRALVLVSVPSGSHRETVGGRLLCDDVVADYRAR